MTKVSVSEQNADSPRKSFSEKDASTSVQIVNLLLLAWKNSSLYPEGHITAIKALENLKSSLEGFFSHHSSLRLSVKRNQLLWDTTILYEAPSDNPSEDLVTLLYRDGIQWFEFHHGLSLEELAYFFSILSKYRMLTEEAEGDIVTGLNDGKLEHITFKAIDIFWEDLPLLDFSTLNKELTETEESPTPAEIADTKDREDPEQRKIHIRSIAAPSLNKM